MTPLFKIRSCAPYAELEFDTSRKKAILIADVSLSVECRGMHIEIEPYSIILVREDIDVHIKTEREKAEMLVIEFDRLNEKYWSYSKCFKNGNKRNCAISCCRMNRQLKSFHEALLLNKSYFEDSEFCKEKLSELMLILSWNTAVEDLDILLGPVRDYDFKQKILDMVNQNPDIKVPELAERLSVTIVKFRQIFKESFSGMNYVEWRQGQRMGTVLTGIKDKDASAEQISDELQINNTASLEYTCTHYLGLRSCEIKSAVKSQSRLNDESFIYLTEKLDRRS